MKIPERNKWEGAIDLDPGPMDVYTDGSLLNERVGSGIYSGELTLHLNFRWPDKCSVSQADFSAIGRLVAHNLHPSRTIYNHLFCKPDG